MSNQYDNYDPGRLLADLRSPDLFTRCEAAEALGEQGDPRAIEPLVAVLEDPEWRVCVAAVKALGELGDARVAEAIAQTLRRTDVSGAFGGRAAALAQATIEALRRLGGSGFQALLDIMHEFAEWEYIGEPTARALGELGDPRALAALLVALHSQVYEVASAGAGALSQLGAQAIAPLIAVLREPDGMADSFARQALKRIGAVVVSPLLETLATATRADERAHIVGALGQHDDDRVLEPLAAALADPDQNVREEAAFALGGCGDLRAIEQLLLARQRVHHANLLSNTLAQIGAPAVEPLMDALRDAGRPVYVRAAAATALGDIGKIRAFDSLIAALSDPEPAVRASATGALGALKDTRAVEYLVKTLQDEVSSARASAVTALGALEDERAFDLLTQIATHSEEDSNVRRAAIFELGWHFPRRALPVLRQVLLESGPPVSYFVLTALTMMGQTAVPLLLEAASVEDLQCKVIASQWLGMYLEHKDCDPHIVAFLAGMLHDSNPHLRYRAAIILGRMGDQRARDVLIEALRSPNERMSWQEAASVLAKIGDERAIPALEEALAASRRVEERSRGDSRADEVLRDVLQETILTIRARLRNQRRIRDDDATHDGSGS